MNDYGNPHANGNGAVTELVGPPDSTSDQTALEASPETLLFRTGLLDPDQLGELVQERVASGRSVDEIVVQRGWLDAETVARALGGDTAAAPALDPHPDPFALPVVELQAEPLPTAAVSFAATPELQQLASEPASDPFAPTEHQLAAEPVSLSPALVSPVVQAPLEAVQHELVQAQVAEPAAQDEPVHVPSSTVEFRVSIRFVGNDCVEIASHADAVEAKAAAHALVAQLSSQRDDWPFVGGRFVRPDAVLSVDIDAVVR